MGGYDREPEYGGPEPTLWGTIAVMVFMVFMAIVSALVALFTGGWI